MKLSIVTFIVLIFASFQTVSAKPATFGNPINEGRCLKELHVILQPSQAYGLKSPPGLNLLVVPLLVNNRPCDVLRLVKEAVK